ncbi:MAG: hypothetical protein WCS89_00670 [Candidatus Paceibacterota bacterium]
MNGIPITQSEIDSIISLRKTGHSLPEIRRITKRGSSTVFKYIKNVPIPSKYISILKTKQGGSKKRAKKAWDEADAKAQELIGNPLSLEQRLCLLIGIYWGEGTKKELNLINSDPQLIKVFVSCLQDIGIAKEQLKINLRLYNGISKREAILFWSNILDIKPERIGKIEIVHGQKIGKLKFGMCRIRVAKGAQYFKLLISLINEIKKKFNALVVQRIE